MQWHKQLERVFKVRGHDGHCQLPASSLPRCHAPAVVSCASPDPAEKKDSEWQRSPAGEWKGRLTWCRIGSCCCVGRLAESCLSPSVQSGNHSTLSCLWRCQGSLTLYQMHSGWIFCSRCDLLLNSSLAGPSFCLAFQRGMQMNW